jgi:hypothetical protein
MKKILAVVCMVMLVITLSVTQAPARGGGGAALLGVGGALLGLGLAIEEANRQQQEQAAFQAAPGVRTALVQCNKCGFSETWQGEGNPPPPSCGCPSSYRWDWQ